MQTVQEKIIKSVYKTYSFVEEDILKFSEIALAGIPEDMEYEKGFAKAKQNLIECIIDKINSDGFVKVFNETVDKIGIHKTFAIFDLIIYDRNISIEAETIYELGTNEKYKEYYDSKNIKKTNNELLKRVISAYKPDIEDDEIEYIPEIYVGPKGDKEVSDYLKSLNGIPILNRREEQELIKKYRDAQKSQDEDEIEEIKSEFIWHYLGLAASHACKVWNKKSDLKLGLMDLIQECNKGLVLAFNKWNENLGYRFSTYAMWWIRQTVDRTIQNENYTISVPVWLEKLIDKKEYFKAIYMHQYNRLPSDEEIMNYLEISESQYQKVLKAEFIRKPLSLDEKIENDDKENRHKSMEIYIADENTNVEEENTSKYERNEILAFFDEILTEKEKIVICNRFGFNKEEEALTLEIIGKKLGITRERARQIEEKAMQKIQENSKRLITPEHKPTGRVVSKEDLKQKLFEQDIKVKIIQYQTKTNRALFECKECGKRFNEESNKLIERGSCPFCGEKNKELIKK